MHWACRWLPAALLALACGTQDRISKEEFLRLETHLRAIEAAGAERWDDPLARLKQESFTTDSMQRLQNQCVQAFDNYHLATGRLAAARVQVESLQRALRNGAPAQELRTAQENAKRTLDETGSVLRRAEELVQRCNAERHLLRAEFSLQEGNTSR